MRKPEESEPTLKFFPSNLSNKTESLFPAWLWPLAVGWGSQQHHDDQQNGGEEQTPEGIVHPQVPPALRKETRMFYLLNKTAVVKQQSQKERKHTDRLTVHQLEDFGGPDDEDDGGCGHSWTTTNAN